jgi:hypothetical protein
MTTRRARGATALLSVQRRGLLRVELLRYYAADPDVRAALADLAVRQPADRLGADYDVFDADLVGLAGRFGLDRLRGDDGTRSGVDMLRLWARLKLGPDDLMRAATSAFRPPEIPDEIPRQYDPRSESREAYDRRIYEYASRREREAEQEGYDFADTASKLPEHLYWLFLRLRSAMKWDKIADRAGTSRPEGITAAGISGPVHRLAAELGIDL